MIIFIVMMMVIVIVWRKMKKELNEMDGGRPTSYEVSLASEVTPYGSYANPTTCISILMSFAENYRNLLNDAQKKPTDLAIW